MSTTIRVADATKRRVRALAEVTGKQMRAVVEEVVAEYERPGTRPIVQHAGRYDYGGPHLSSLAPDEDTEVHEPDLTAPRIRRPEPSRRTSASSSHSAVIRAHSSRSRRSSIYRAFVSSQNT